MKEVVERAKINNFYNGKQICKPLVESKIHGVIPDAKRRYLFLILTKLKIFIGPVFRDLDLYIFSVSSEILWLFGKVLKKDTTHIEATLL